MPSVAVIGTGIAGMACGYFLRGSHEVTFFEKEPRPGGHTNTVVVDEEGSPIPIDTGFMVYNEVTYPHLTRFFRELDIPTQPTSMSFSVQHLPSALEYCGTGLSGLFAQRRNLLNIRFIQMLAAIDRFNKECLEVLEGDRYASSTVSEYAKIKEYPSDMLDKYLLPMSSAIWSTEPDRMMGFPVVTLVRFFKNHGLLGMSGHLSWRTVTGGSKVYRDRVLAHFPGRVELACAAVRVGQEDGRAWVEDSRGRRRSYDRVILACHADEALRILASPTDREKELLSCFRYQKNKATLHTDASVMPRSRRAWSSWNTRIEERAGKFLPTTIYYMNSLQQVSRKKDYFVSINDTGSVDRSKVLWETEYTHPVYGLEAVAAQKRLYRLNDNGVIFFCGSYFRYGFHEDALDSALSVCERILGGGFWR